jgi:cytochrome c553
MKAEGARADFVERSKTRNKKKTEKRKANTAMAPPFKDVDIADLKAMISSHTPNDKNKAKQEVTFKDSI